MRRLHELALTGATSLILLGCASGPEAATPPDVKTVQRSALRERAVALLTDAAMSESALMRANAVEGLHAVPTRLEGLVGPALHDENEGVRFVAAMTVGKFKVQEHAGRIEEMLDSRSEHVQAGAIYAASRLGLDVDISPLASMLRSRDPHVRAQAAFVLGELGNPSAIPMLREAARRDAPRASLAAMRLLRLQVAEALAKLGDPTAMEMIRASLYPSRPEDLEATALAVQIIGEVEDRRSIDQLIYLTAAAGPERMPAEVRLAAAAALAKMGEVGGAFIAEEHWTSVNPALRAQAAHVFGLTSGENNLNRLAAMMDDRSGMVRVTAAAAMLAALEGPAGSDSAWADAEGLR